MKPEERIKEIEKQITRTAIIDTPGTIMVGLGLYAKFGSGGNAFHPLLNNMLIVHAMLAVGTAIVIWGCYRILTLSREKIRLANEHNL